MGLPGLIHVKITTTFDEKSNSVSKQAEEDEEHRKQVKWRLAAKCPHCGSHRYIEATWAEECSSCGYSQGY